MSSQFVWLTRCIVSLPLCRIEAIFLHDFCAPGVVVNPSWILLSVLPFLIVNYLQDLRPRDNPGLLLSHLGNTPNSKKTTMFYLSSTEIVKKTR